MYSHLFTKKPVKDDPSLAPLSSQASRSTEEVDLLEDAYDDPIGILACAPIFREESDCPREEAAAVEEGLRVAAAAVAEDVRVAMAAEADIELEIAAVAVREEVAVAAVAREEIASAMEEAQAADGVFYRILRGVLRLADCICHYDHSVHTLALLYATSVG